ncbi:long-chain fatty acid--CoA ligase [Bacillus sp. APMAM]|nr:long-chain fatty acid--CoA ligase [Bacillus sp. APMAM]RTZ55987.1 long-chain fatty acid--CoA ligase [Bacillus sp. SAJ1]
MELDWISSRARLTPNKTAIIDVTNDTSITYSELNERSNKWAYLFAEKRIEKGDRVALLAANQKEVFEIMFACSKLGAIFVPLNWRLSVDELNYILEDCNPNFLIYNEKFSETVLHLKNVADKLALNDLIQSEKKVVQPFSTSPTETDPWLMIYTGGTTGKPKGVILSHQSIIWNAINTIISWGLTSEEVTLNYLPLFHTGGINALSVPILMNGGTVVIGDQFHAEEAVHYLNKYKCTIALFVPTMYHMMVGTKGFQASTFPSMKVFLSGAAPCPLSIYEKFFAKGLPFKEGYGLTEAGPNNFFISPNDAIWKKGSVGKPMAFNQIKLIKIDGTEAGTDEVGEILIRGKHAFKEYWNNPIETAEAWKDGWLYSGDLGKKDRDGYYYIVGRKKDMIITGGENVYPLEIEHWLCEHPDVDEASVVGLSDEKWGERVTAFIVLKTDQIGKEEVLKIHCSQKLAKYKIPKEFVFLQELPKTHVGKIDKKYLKEQYEHNWKNA